MTGAGKVAGIVTLTKADGVSRNDFIGSTTVKAGGYLLNISEAVEVYNTTTEQWTTLEAAKSFTDSFTVYYDGGMTVRMIVAE